MNCKNCGTELRANEGFCGWCGAKVINKRITFKTIFTEFLTAIGWDNKYFFTLKSLIVHPQVVFKEYLDGTRKKYVNPFTFFAIGAAITVFVFTQFADEYVQRANYISDKNYELIYNKIIEITEKEAKVSLEEFIEIQKNISSTGLRSLLKYFTPLSFILLPFYALIALFVFKKPYNFGEHFVINAFVQGITFIGITLFFVLSLSLHPSIFYLGSLFTIIYYIYAYARLYEYTLKKVILKLLKFIGITFVACFLCLLLGFLIGILLK